jgi:hypothetical protein
MDNKDNNMNYLDFGTPISFRYTAQYLPHKSVTRRDWKDSHATKFIKAFDRAIDEGKQLRVPAIDKGYHAGGKQIGWLLISDRPCKQKLADMASSSLKAEGGMCATVDNFIAKYFKGDSEKEVWVIHFKFEPCQSEPSKYLQELEVSASDLSQLADSTLPKQLKSPQPQGQYTQSTFQARQSGTTCEPSIPSLDNSTASPPKLSPSPSESSSCSSNSSLKVLTSSKHDEHYTPEPIINAAREVMGEIDCDPMSCAAANKIVRATHFYDKDDDGLISPWLGRVWLNPAFSLADKAVEKLLAAYQVGVVTEACLLIKAVPDTKRHQSLAAFPYCEWRGRIKFIADGNSQVAPFAVLIFYLGKNFPKFREVFSKFGNIRLGQKQVDELEDDRRDLLAKVAQLQLELAKKSEAASELDRLDWLEHDINKQVSGAEHRLRELEIDREILPFEIFSKQRLEWATNLQTLNYIQRAIASINVRFTEEYRQITERSHSDIETSLEGYTPDFAVGKQVESSQGLIAKIDRYRFIFDEWIAWCEVRAPGKLAISRGTEFYIRATELLSDFKPYSYKPIKYDRTPTYGLGSTLKSRDLKQMFRGLKIPDRPSAYCTEIESTDGSIWQAVKGCRSIEWMCEVLPNGSSRSPRILHKKNDHLPQAVTNPNSNSFVKYGY